MDIYTQKSRWKIYLVIAALLVVGVSLFYTIQLVKKIGKNERERVELWAKAIQKISSEEIDDPSFLLEVIANNNIPALIVDEKDHILDVVNLPDPTKKENKAFLQKTLGKMKAKNAPILISNEFFSLKVYYSNSFTLTLITYFPYLQFLLIGLLLFLGYLALNAARRAEQNLVWVGLAKETAHQLGTPISAILAWIEYMKPMAKESEELQMVVDELGKDVDRLGIVADRFSKIGAEPKLKTQDIYPIIVSSFGYMKTRAPRKVTINPPAQPTSEILVELNKPLFDWVLENLLRNALDAMEGKGDISSKVLILENTFILEISDTGKGIPGNRLKTIFEPGYSTKKRGWGLGLSLTKRIIENYHSGKIFVLNSKINEGSTFRIELPIKQSP